MTNVTDIGMLENTQRTYKGKIDLITGESYKYFFDGRIKECTKCNRLLTLDNFIKDRTKPYGIYSSCKACYKLEKGQRSKRVPIKPRACAICKKIFTPRHWQVDVNSGIVCSIECRHKYISLKRREKTGCKTKHENYIMVRDDITKKFEREHIKLIEKSIGRKLKIGEVVHHIDCDKTNNNLNNLCLMDKTTHAIAHTSLNALVKDLIKEGIIFFDKPDGVYLIRSNNFGFKTWDSN